MPTAPAADSPLADRPGWALRPYKGGALLKLRVQPNAPRTALAPPVAGVVRLKLHAPPVKGAANKACLHFLAALFRLPKGELALVRGAAAREKWIWIKTRTPDEITQVFNETLANG